jgi:hypothetical protein
MDMECIVAYVNRRRTLDSHSEGQRVKQREMEQEDEERDDEDGIDLD